MSQLTADAMELGKFRGYLAPEKLAIPDDEQGDDWERKVLADFSEEGRLKAIPVNERKRLAVIKWFARKFDDVRVLDELSRRISSLRES